MTATTSAAAAATGSSNRASDAAARLQALHDRLLLAVEEVTSAEGWQQMLRTAAALPTYSPTNLLLITSQCRHASAVAGFQAWKQLGRSVRKGEKGIAILAPILRRSTAGKEATAEDDERPTTAPESTGAVAEARRLTGFRVVHVFDISQTDGPPLPEPPATVLLEGQAPAGLIEGLTAQVHGQGFQLLRHNFDIPHPGQGSPNGVTDFFAKTVIVRPDLSEAQFAKTLSHELGHVLLHGHGQRPADLTRPQAEVEAESVAYVVTAAHGLDSSTYTVPYVAGWAGTDPTLVARTAERVLSTARDVLRRTPPPAALELPDSTREQLRDRDRDRSDTRARPAPTGEQTRAREPVVSLADRSRLTRTGQLTPGRPEPRSTARSRGDQDNQGRLW